MFINSIEDVGAGQPGDLTRSQDAVIEPAFSAQPTDMEPGRALQFDAAGKAAYYLGTGTFAGISVRAYPALSGEPASDVTPAGRMIGVLRRGNVLVKCSEGTPVRGAPVYVVKANKGTGAAAIKAGDFSATAAGNQIVQGATWAVNGTDKNKLAELSII